jgi:hypothetical protein
MTKRIPAAAAAIAALFAASSAFAQTSPSPTAPTAPAEKMEPAPGATPTPTMPKRQPTTDVGVKLTEDEAKALIDANVVSSDQKTVGEVAAIQRDGDGKVVELHADIGGFLGIGETRVRIMPSQFTVSDKRILLTLTKEQVDALPKIEKK